MSPVVIEGRTIARTFWGKAWCDNLERYSDYANRLPRGRTYVRNGSVVDLQIAPGEVHGAGQRLGDLPGRGEGHRSCQGAVELHLHRLRGRHRLAGRAAAGALLQGRHGAHLPAEDRALPLRRPRSSSRAVARTGPRCASTSRPCSTAIGARLDQRPELLFRLRWVDEKELIAKAGSGLSISKVGPAADRVLAADGLSELFGLEMTTVEDDPAPPARAKPTRGRSTKPKLGAKKAPPKGRVAGSASTPGPAAKPGLKTEKKSSPPPKKAAVRNAASKTRGRTQKPPRVRG